jgi:ABC-type transport system substrate-binding protein
VFVRAQTPADKNVGSAWMWLGPTAAQNVYHSANMFTSTGVHTTGNDPKADELYQAAATEVDEAKAKKAWQDMMKYAYDTMWVNVPIVNVPSFAVVGPQVGNFTFNTHRSLQEAFAGIQRKA